MNQLIYKPLSNTFCQFFSSIDGQKRQGRGDPLSWGEEGDINVF